jgi:hypothetical protein
MLGVRALVLGAQKVLRSIAACGGSSSSSSTGGPGAGSSSTGGSGTSSSLRLAGPGAGQQELAQQLQAALRDLDHGSAAVPPAGEGSVDQDAAVELVSLMLQMVERGRQVAALVEAYYQQPEQRAAAALELAPAAATRSCANLWCPNVGSEGREAEGRPNQRCLACRAVRYCCRECSVVDWRAGHRRVCGALAAAATAAAAEAETGAAALPP